MKNYNYTLLIAILITQLSCNESETISQAQSDDWLIPADEVRDGGPGKDGIPALLNPEMISSNEANYLLDEDLVIGYVYNGEAKAYSHKVLDWHEIINDDIGGKAVAVTYCPLTGTAIGWNRTHDGETTTFGVSGLLYNSNLIPYDRATDSNWTQIGMDCVNGARTGESISSYQLMETSWSTWKSMYPETTVVSTNTGHSRNYERYPYGNYRTDESLIFPVSNEDDRLHEKERVHGVISNGQVKVYRFSHFTEPIITDTFDAKEFIIVGNEAQNFIVSFYQKTLDGQMLTFSVPSDFDVETGFSSSIILEDQLGNAWDVFGRAISGPNTGETLEPTRACMAYWFSLAPFYDSPTIYEP